MNWQARVPWWLQWITPGFWLGHEYGEYPGLLRDPTYGIRQRPRLAAGIAAVGAAPLAVLLTAKVAVAGTAYLAARLAAAAAARMAAAKFALAKAAAIGLGVYGAGRAVDAAFDALEAATRRWERSPYDQPAALLAPRPMPRRVSAPTLMPQPPAPVRPVRPQAILPGYVVPADV